jgi:hypothetical protein
MDAATEFAIRDQHVINIFVHHVPNSFVGFRIRNNADSPRTL